MSSTAVAYRPSRVTATAARRPAAHRVYRGTVVGALTTLLSAMGHSLGGGGLPHPAMLLIAGAAVTGLAAAADGIVLGLRALLGLLAAAQMLIHLLAALDHPQMPGDPSSMLVFHVVAALATAAVLAGADRGIASVRKVFLRILQVRTYRPPVHSRLPVPPATADRAAICRAVLARRAPRRGPPRLVTVPTPADRSVA